MDTIDTLQTMIDGYVERLPEGSQRPAYGFQCYFARGRVFGLYDGYAIVLKFDKPTGDSLLEMRMGKRFRHATNAFGRAWIRIYPEKVQSEEVLETLIRQSYDFVLGSGGE